MIDAHLLSDLLAYSTQLACIVALGGALPALFRLDAAGVRYAYFRVLLVVCIVLPWLQNRQAAAIEATTQTITTAVAVVTGPIDPAGGTLALPWLAVLTGCLASGIAARMIWVAIGLVRLSRLRRAEYLSTCLPEHDELQQMLGTRAEIRYIAGLSQPVTFGLYRPLVLLPDSVRTHPVHVQRAVLSHELIHVQRRDWVWLVAEEIVRAIFWFHPGVWWLISRVQLAREEAVDELAMLATGTRRGYLEALAIFADETPLVPAAAFARRRHLFRRMQLISKEAGMSSKRVAWSCALMTVIVVAGGWWAVKAFPLREAAAQELLTDVGPLEKQAKAITPENPVPRRIYSIDPSYPNEAASVDANAMVTLMLTLDQSGRVAEVRRLGVSPIASATASPQDPQLLRAAFDALVNAAADAVRQWQYDSPADAPLSIRVTFAFSPNGKPRLVSHDGWSVAYPGQFAGLPAAGGRISAPPPPPPPPPPRENGPSPAWASGAIRVGGAILQPVKTKHVNPKYPADAQAARVQGVVIVEARIGIDGKISNARIARSVPMLDQAALDAVMLWEFTPTRLNGQLVPVLTTITVQFTLA